MESKGRSGAVVLAVLGALVAAALIIGLAVSAERSSPSFGTGAPEAVVQEYVRHVLAGRMSEALALLKNPERCAESFASVSMPADVRADLISSTRSSSGDFAYVGVRFEGSTNGLLEEPDNGWQVTFALEQTEGGWKLLQPTWPVSICGFHSNSPPGP